MFKRRIKEDISGAVYLDGKIVAWCIVSSNGYADKKKMDEGDKKGIETF